jgi:serine/threonine-protein kinase
MSQLTHPNTVRVFLYGELEDGSLYIVMEFLEGKNLNQTVRAQGPFPIERALPVLIQACGALEEAHRAGIIHRDLKPENIFLAQQGGLIDFPKVLDFGLAKLGERQMRPGSVILTQEGMVFGTPEFMSPEQAQGRTLTPASDVYSLAVILYEVLTGKLPFDARTPLDFLQLHVTAAPIPLSERVQGRTFPPLLDRVMARALSKKAEQRFASATEFGQALQAVLEGATDLPANLLEPPAQVAATVPTRSEARAVGSGPGKRSPLPPRSGEASDPSSSSAKQGVAAAALSGDQKPPAKLALGTLAGIAFVFMALGVGLAVVVMKVFMGR